MAPQSDDADVADGDWITDKYLQSRHACRGRIGDQLLQRFATLNASGRGSVKDNHLAIGNALGARGLGERSNTFVTLCIREPDNLKWAVALDQTAGVVVDRLARTRQQTRRGVVVGQNHGGVGLIALQGDANSHLSHGGARKRVRSTQSLRTQDHMHAECAALAHQSIQQQR